LKGDIKKSIIETKSREKAIKIIEKKNSIEFKEVTKLEKQTLKRLKKKEKKVVKKKKAKPSKYIHRASRMFSKYSVKLVKTPFFHSLERDLIKAKLLVTPISYISIILFTTFLSIFAGFLIFLFFLFFSITAELPIIVVFTGSFLLRIGQTFWIILAVPVITFLSLYVYPSLEKKSAEVKINRELPFATIHMSAISGSLVEPSRIFDIMVATKDYPHLEKEFKKLINEINIYGYDLATALRSVAFNTPSAKLSELLNGFATTINSGGDLTSFFDKRSESLLLDHRIDSEKSAKAAETFMDIYISVVIAAPMILMLLLMMISISGLSFLTPTMVTIIMVLGVSAANVIFLTFLHLKGSIE